MKKKVVGTKLQKAAIEKIVKEGKSPSVAMLEVGYSKGTSKNPINLTKSSYWEEIMEKNLPDNLLAEKHKELLTIPKKVRTFIKGDLTNEYEELDSQAVSKGLDMAYKLKGHYKPEKKEISGEVNIGRILDDLEK